MNNPIRKKMTLTVEEQETVINGQPEIKTQTFSKALLFFYDEIRRLEESGKKLDYGLENGQVKTRIWFDQKSMAVLMQFSYQQVEIDMQELAREMVKDIDLCWQEKQLRKNKRD